MSLKCRVFRDEKGQIDFVNTENGNRSKLFDNLVNITGGNKDTALNIYALTEVDELKEAMDSKLNAFKERLKNIVKVAPSTSERVEDIMFSKTSATKPTYYSNAIGAISNLADKNPKNTQGWIKQLTDTQKNGGIKNVNQELEWIGLEDYLTSYVKENNPKAGNIPSSVVEDYIKSNQIEIVDVSKGGFAERDRMNALRNQAQREGNYDLVNYYDDEVLPGLKGNQPTKYEGYQLSGGENYREVLLTMPAKTIENDKVFTVKNRKDFWKDPSNFSAEEVEDGFLVSSVRGGRKLIEKDYYIKTKEDAINSYREDNLQLLDIFSEEQGVEDYDFYDENGNYFNTYTAANIGQAISEYKSLTETKEDEYKSSHWSEKNILAHIRLNEKVLQNGDKVLIVNEIQSDWAQEGRKKGFIETGKFDKSKVTTKESGSFIEIYYDGEWVDKLLTTYSTKEEIERDILRSAETDFNLKKKAVTGKIQNMPYKNTDQWVGLATRRVLQMAAQQGYSGVAFATGQQSADMYSLARQADELRYSKNEDGTYNVNIFKDAESINNKDNIPENELSDYVGKEIAQRIVNNEGKQIENEVSLKGVNLEVGGEGMKTFYDKILTKVAQKEAQRFDKNAKLETVDFSKQPLRVETIVDGQDDEEKRVLVDYLNNIVDAQYGSKFENDQDYINAFQDAYNNSQGVTINKDKLALAQQPYIAITDKMRSELGKAIPMFSKNQGQKAPTEVLDQVTDRLKQSGLANNVYKMTNAQIEAKLVELGVEPTILDKYISNGKILVEC